MQPLSKEMLLSVVVELRNIKLGAKNKIWCNKWWNEATKMPIKYAPVGVNIGYMTIYDCFGKLFQAIPNKQNVAKQNLI